MTARLLGVFDSIPHVKHGGGGIQSYATLIGMAQWGFDVSALILPGAMASLGADHDRDVADLQRRGVKVIEIFKHDQGMRIAGMPEGDLFVNAAPGPQANAMATAHVAERLGAQGAFTYHWPGLQALSFVRSPKLGVVVDPIHQPLLLRRKFSLNYASPEEKATLFMNQADEDAYVASSERGMVGLLNSCRASVCFAAHHARQYREMGAAECRYMPCPLPDPRSGPLPDRRPGERFRILLIGHLRGIATLTGIELLAFGVLPALQRLLPPDSFEIHIVGGFEDTLPADLKRALDHPAVVFRGQVAPPDDEFLQAHVSLVPTPAELGMRVRVATAFSYGAPVVAHRANACGIPEMAHGVNCMMGDDGESLARCCVDLFHNPQRRESIGAEGRRTFEQVFAIDVAGKGLAKLMEDVVFDRPSASIRHAVAAASTIPPAEHLANGRWRDAADAFEAMLKGAPDDGPALLGAGLALSALGETVKAVARLTHAALLEHGGAATHLALGDALAALGETAAARAAWRRAQAIDPSSVAKLRLQ